MLSLIAGWLSLGGNQFFVCIAGIFSGITENINAVLSCKVDEDVKKGRLREKCFNENIKYDTLVNKC